jgi:hypothetical protein
MGLKVKANEGFASAAQVNVIHDVLVFKKLIAIRDFC